MKKTFAFAVLSSTMLASVAEARKSHHTAAVAPEPEPVAEPPSRKDPFASIPEPEPQPQPKSRGSHHQTQQQAAPAEPPAKTKKDDGAD